MAYSSVTDGVGGEYAGTSPRGNLRRWEHYTQPFETLGKVFGESTSGRCWGVSETRRRVEAWLSTREGDDAARSVLEESLTRQTRPGAPRRTLSATALRRWPTAVVDALTGWALLASNRRRNACGIGNGSMEALAKCESVPDRSPLWFWLRGATLTATRFRSAAKASPRACDLPAVLAPRGAPPRPPPPPLAVAFGAAAEEFMVEILVMVSAIEETLPMGLVGNPLDTAAAASPDGVGIVRGASGYRYPIGLEIKTTVPDGTRREARVVTGAPSDDYAAQIAAQNAAMPFVPYVLFAEFASDFVSVRDALAEEDIYTPRGTRSVDGHPSGLFFEVHVCAADAGTCGRYKPRSPRCHHVYELLERSPADLDVEGRVQWSEWRLTERLMSIKRDAAVLEKEWGVPGRPASVQVSLRAFAVHTLATSRHPNRPVDGLRTTQRVGHVLNRIRRARQEPDFSCLESGCTHPSARGDFYSVLRHIQDDHGYTVPASLLDPDLSVSTAPVPALQRGPGGHGHPWMYTEGGCPKRPKTTNL